MLPRLKMEASSEYQPVQRSRHRIATLVMLSIGIPTLGLILGSIEIAFGNHRFGTLLILLAIASSFAFTVLLRLGIEDELAELE